MGSISTSMICSFPPPIRKARMNSEIVNIVTLKWGTLYGPEYVNRLYRGVQRHLKRTFRFICFTDNKTGMIDGIESLDFSAFPVSEHLSWTVWRKFSLLQNEVPSGSQHHCLSWQTESGSGPCWIHRNQTSPPTKPTPWTSEHWE